MYSDVRSGLQIWKIWRKFTLLAYVYTANSKKVLLRNSTNRLNCPNPCAYSQDLRWRAFPLHFSRLLSVYWITFTILYDQVFGCYLVNTQAIFAGGIFLKWLNWCFIVWHLHRWDIFLVVSKKIRLCSSYISASAHVPLQFRNSRSIYLKSSPCMVPPDFITTITSI
jgi:hypothetical protein